MTAGMRQGSRFIGEDGFPAEVSLDFIRTGISLDQLAVPVADVYTTGVTLHTGVLDPARITFSGTYSSAGGIGLWRSSGSIDGGAAAGAQLPSFIENSSQLLSGTSSTTDFLRAFTNSPTMIVSNRMATNATTNSGTAFIDQITFIAGVNAGSTLGTYHSFRSAPLIENLTGTITSGHVHGFTSMPTVDLGATLTSIKHFYVGGLTFGGGGGTVGTEYGLYIPALAGATTSYGIYNLSKSVLNGGVYGDTASNGDLTLRGTTHGTHSSSVIHAVDRLTAENGLYGSTANGASLDLYSTTGTSASINMHHQTRMYDLLYGDSAAAGTLIMAGSSSPSAPGTVLLLRDDPTYTTSSPPALFGVSSARTITQFNSAGALFPALASFQAALVVQAVPGTAAFVGYDYAPSVTSGVALSTNALTRSGSVFQDRATYTSTGSSLTSVGVYVSFASTPTFTRTSTNVWTNGLLQMFLSNPTLTGTTLTSLTSFSAGFTYNSGTCTTLNSFATLGTVAGATITTINGLLTGLIANNSSAITTVNGVKIADHTLSGGATVGTSIGIDIGALSSATTTNIGLRIALAGTYALQLSSDAGTAPSGITFGTTSVVQLYRDAANSLTLLQGNTLTARVKPRVTTIASSATPTINTDQCDAVTITALAAAITSMTTNLTGTPNNFDKLTFRIKDNGSARAITWGASFVAEGVALPTTTVISKVLTVGFIYDSVKTAWGCVSAITES